MTFFRNAREFFSQERHPAFLLPGCAPAPLAPSFAQPRHPAGGFLFFIASLNYMMKISLLLRAYPMTEVTVLRNEE